MYESLLLLSPSQQLQHNVPMSQTARMQDCMNDAAMMIIRDCDFMNVQERVH